MTDQNCTQIKLGQLYTKSYELFKKYRAGQGRMTLYVAYQIARTYHDSEKYDLAVKFAVLSLYHIMPALGLTRRTCDRFFDRIAKTYKTERWDPLLVPILSMWYNCARQLGDTDLMVRLLVNMLTPGARSQCFICCEDSLNLVVYRINGEFRTARCCPSRPHENASGLHSLARIELTMT